MIQVDRLRAACWMSAALLMGGCAGDGDEALVEACPLAQIAVPSDSIGHSDDQGRIHYVATIQALTSGCQIDDGQVTVDLAFDVKLERGPVFDGQLVLLTYYIATVDPERAIVDKELLDVEFAIAEGQPERVIRETVTLQLPVSTDATGGNYNLYLGFQPEQRR